MKKIFSTFIIVFITLSSVIGQNTSPAELAKPNVPVAEKPKVQAPANPNAPVIKFESEVHDYGKVPVNSDGACQFKFKNTGKEPLILTNVKASCGCTVPSWPKDPIAPGANAIIDVKYNSMNRAHTINKSITVFSNASDSIVVLRIQGEVYEDPAPEKPVQ